VGAGKCNRSGEVQPQHPSASKTAAQSNSAYEKEAFTAQEMRDWVDYSEDNLWVLCDVHHRAKFLGIHEITYPIWCPMDLLLDDFEEYVKEQVQKYQPAKNKVGKAKAKRSHGRK
jgi:hypothetical protein